MTEHEDIYNSSLGELTGYDCPKCNNRGYFMYIKDGYDFLRECECLKVRRVIDLSRRCGLGDILNTCKFENYKRDEKWQEMIYATANNFINSNANAFYIGGQVGIGKSFICSAIVREMVLDGKDCHYAVWSDLVTKLKQNIYDDTDKYESGLERVKNVEVLYIDDLFKSPPTKSDLDIAFKIINYRYNLCRSNHNTRFVTIISSERTIGDLSEFDEAVSSRIIEMASQKFVICIDKDENKDYRVKNLRKRQN